MAGHFPRRSGEAVRSLRSGCLTPGFAQFAGFARAAGRPLVASDGFGFYIPTLKRHGGLEYITAIYSNLRIGDNGG